MVLLTDNELARAVEALPGWELAGRRLERTFVFGSFGEAMRFVNGAATVAEEMGHHPDMDIRYKRVKIGLMTHDAGGVTSLDVRLAQGLEEL